VHHRAAAEDHPAPGGQYSSQISASLVATRTRRAYSIHFNQTGDKSRADARTQSQPLLSNQRSRYCTLIYRRDQTTAPLTAVLQIACTSPLLRKHVQKWPCLHVGNPTAKTEYFPSEVIGLVFRVSLWCHLVTQWRRNRGFGRFNEPGPPSSWGPRVVGPQTNFRQDS